MPTTTAPPSKTLDRKALALPATAAPRRAVKVAPEGIVRAIVAVTGVVDAVNDLIVPGAFKRSLGIRNPKVVDDHEWGNKAGRTLHIEEWKPGDKRLPTRTKEGRPWPKDAGALVATMQYNMRSERGRESYEWVRFYAEANEAEFSIGYKVPEGHARKRHDGVRVILMVDLFELSHVLFGAAPLSMALEVKNMHGGTAGTHTRPALGAVGRATDDDEDDDKMPTPKINKNAPWEDDDDDRASMESKTAAAVVLEAKSVLGDGNRGNAEDLRKWFVSGAEGAITWGAEGDFAQCVAIASEHMSEEQAKGYCNLRHHDALGIYPAQHDGGMESKTAVYALLEAKTMLADMEAKAASQMKGSYEECRDLIREAARDVLNAGGDCYEWVNTVATYPAEVVVTGYRNDDTSHSFFIAYTYDPEAGTVELGEPRPVELSLVAEPKHPHGPVDEFDVEEQTVLNPMIAELERMWGISETKAGAALRARFVAYAEGLQGKSADQEPVEAPEDAPAPPEGAVEATDDTFTADNLPEGDWAAFRKTEPIEALRMDGTFTVETREGVVECDDGWLALDSDGFPYPIAADEFENVYEPEPAAGDDVEADVEAPSVEEDLETKETDEVTEEGGDDETVTIPADEHFAAMDALEVPDEESTEDD